MAIGLEIYFDEEAYSSEGDIRGLSNISLSLGETRAPFRMELIPVTVDVAKTQYNLTDFLTLDDITNDQEALSGDIFIMKHILHCPSDQRSTSNANKYMPLIALLSVFAGSLSKLSMQTPTYAIHTRPDAL